MLNRAYTFNEMLAIVFVTGAVCLSAGGIYILELNKRNWNDAMVAAGCKPVAGSDRWSCPDGNLFSFSVSDDAAQETKDAALIQECNDLWERKGLMPHIPN